MNDISDDSKDNPKKDKKNHPPKKVNNPDRTLDEATKTLIESVERQRRAMNEIERNLHARQMASIIASGGFYKTVEKLANTVNNIEKSIRLKYIDKISSVNSAIVRMVRDPILNLQNILRSAYTEPIMRLNRQIEETYISSITAFEKSFRSAYNDSIVAFQKQIEEIARGPAEAARNIVELSSSNIFLEMEKGIKTLNDYANTLPKYEAAIANKDTLVFQDKSYPISDIQSLIEEALSNYQGTLDEQNFEKGINRLIKEIQKNKDPVIQKVILNFIISLIVAILISFLNPMIDKIREHVAVNDKRTATKIIQRTVTQTEIPRNVLVDFRFVTADVLIVRAEDKQKSKIVARLYFGQVVLLIKKNKNWSSVEWKDDDGDVIIRGWVFTRYLRKFN